MNLNGRPTGSCSVRLASPPQSFSYPSPQTRARSGSRWGPRKSSPDKFVEFRTKTANSPCSLDPPEPQNPRVCGFFRTILRKYRIRETGVWSRRDLNSRPHDRLCLGNCPRVWPSIWPREKQQCCREFHRRKFASHSEPRCAFSSFFGTPDDLVTLALISGRQDWLQRRRRAAGYPPTMLVIMLVLTHT
jgi:hypothetical protein